MKKFILSLSVVFLLSASTTLLWGQNPEWKAYSGGLSRIQKIVDDGDYLWLATYGGLVKFNKISHESTVYDKTNSELPSYDIVDMAMDKTNALWMATDIGVSRFDGTTWNTFTHKNSPLQFPIYALATHDNDVWVATYNGIARYNGAEWVLLPLTSEMPWLRSGYIHVDNRGSLVLPYIDTVYTYTGTTWSSVSVLPKGVSSATFISNARNATWILGRYKAGYPQRNFLVSSTNGNWQQHDITPLDTHNVTAMLISDAAMWFATKSGTIFRYENAQWNTYTVKLEKDVLREEYKDERITTMTIDNEGILWCGTNAYKLFNLVDTTWATIPYTPVRFAPIRPAFGGELLQFSSIAVNTDQSLWLGYASNWAPTEYLTHFTGTHFYNDSPPASTQFLAVDSKGRKWAASYSGLWKLENGTWQQVSDNNFFCIYIDRNDNIWLGTEQGIEKYDHTRWTEYTLDSSDNNLRTHAITQDRNGTIWCTTYQKLFAFDGTAWETYSHENVPAIYRMPYPALSCDSNGVLWIGMQSSSRFDTTALVSFDGTTWRTYTSYNSALPSNSVYRLITDRKGTLWIAGHEELTKVENGVWTTFTPDNSPFPSGSDIACFAVDSSNNLWIGMNNFEGGTLLAYREGGVLVGVQEQPKPVHQPALLTQNAPNPASARTSIRYTVPENTTTMPVRLQLCNALGMPIATLANEYKTSGTYTAEFDVSSLPSGTYYYQLTVGSTTQTKQMVVVK